MTLEERLSALDRAARPLVTPSILSCDFARIAEVFATLEAAGATAAHLDVMDGHFVPNLSYGPPVIKEWRKATNLVFDAHLMIDNPGRFLDDYLDAGCDEVIFHIEVVPRPEELLGRIRRAGRRAGLALNPPTPLSHVEPYLDAVDKILVMSVMPGFGGQEFDASVREKVRRLHALRPGLTIAIDGGIKSTNAAEVASDGAAQLVVGSGIFRHPDSIARAIREMNDAARGVRSGAGGAGKDRGT